MLKLCLSSALLFFSSPAIGQFNTVNIIKASSSVQVAEPAAPVEPSPVPAALTPPGLQVSMPLQASIVSSPYGKREDPLTGMPSQHRGIDFRARRDAVLSIMPGKVKKVGYSQGLGGYIEIEHGPYRSVYGHLSVFFVRESMSVSAGEVIAITGNTGRSTGEHLHFAIKHKERFVNPAPYLDMIYRKTETGSSTAPLPSLR